MPVQKNIFKNLKNFISEAKLSQSEKAHILDKLNTMSKKKINLLITGPTGVGKSSTINALFGVEVSTVGRNANPETMNVEKYVLDNLILWDSPGLGDGKEADERHSRNIINKLLEKDDDGNALIDLVLVILNGGSRDLGTSYELINNVIIPNLGKDKENRILVAINQCDQAMKGHYWNFQENRPEAKLISFLNEKVQSIRTRIREATGLDIEPIYYSAGYSDEYIKQHP